ncbi:MAG: hypothetical protein ABSB71_07900 [Candidatus Bathyarchaeia archaeon]|jgi:hypothetical protein
MKATIPKEIEVFLELKKGDKLDWTPLTHGTINNYEKVAIVRRVILSTAQKEGKTE